MHLIYNKKQFAISKVTVDDAAVIVNYLRWCKYHNYKEYQLKQSYIEQEILHGEYSNAYKLLDSNDFLVAIAIFHNVGKLQFTTLSLHFYQLNHKFLTMQFGYSLSFKLFPYGWFAFTTNPFIKTYIEKRLNAFCVRNNGEENLYFFYPYIRKNNKILNIID